MPVKVAVVDDHPLVVAGLTAVLAPYAETVITVLPHSPATNALPAPDIVLHDSIATPNDLPYNPALARRLESPKYVVFSWEPDPRRLLAAVTQGACAYLSKTASPCALVRGLIRIHRGERLGLPATMTGRRGRTWAHQQHGLSERESEILDLIALGVGNAEIAQQLHLSINTVKTYIRSAYRKIGVTTRAQAVIWSMTSEGADISGNAPSP